MAPSVQRPEVWLTPTTRVPCSNAAKTRSPYKFAVVTQTGKPISTHSSPHYQDTWRRYCCLTSSLLGEEAVASPSNRNTLWRVSTTFTRSAITPPEVNGFGWNLGHSEYIVWSWPWQILGAIRQKQERESELKFCFFCPVDNARLYRFPVSQISRKTKSQISHKTWIYVAMNPFEKFFWKFARKGSFSQKGQLLREYRPWLPASGAISPKWLQIAESHDRLAGLCNVGFPSVPLESTQSHSVESAQGVYFRMRDHKWFTYIKNVTAEL